MNVNANTLKMAEQALASHKQKLATTANRDQVRRQIAAMEARIRDMRAQLAATGIGG